MITTQVGALLAYQHPTTGTPHGAEVLEIQPNRIICRIALGWPQIKHFDRI